jgi:hypothetical protein
MGSEMKTSITPFDFAMQESLPNYMFTQAHHMVLILSVISLQCHDKQIEILMNGLSATSNSR